MTNNARFVICDDNPDDRSLVRRELEAGFPGCEVAEVSDQAGMAAVLARQPVDVLITDYELRWSNGLRVLGEAKLRRPETSVIMFTGSGSQEVAVEGMKGGLDDYLVKGAKHYARIPLAVRAALERRDLRRRAADLEARYRSLLDRLNVGVFRADAYGRLTEANAAFLRLLGVRTLEDANASPDLGRILWDRGTPGPMDLVREIGDQRMRRVSVSTPGRPARRVRVIEVVTQLGNERVIDGVLAEDSDPAPP